MRAPGSSIDGRNAAGEVADFLRVNAVTFTILRDQMAL